MAGLRLAFTDSIPDHLRAHHGSSGKKESSNVETTAFQCWEFIHSCELAYIECWSYFLCHIAMLKFSLNYYTTVSVWPLNQFFHLLLIVSTVYLCSSIAITVVGACNHGCF